MKEVYAKGLEKMLMPVEDITPLKLNPRRGDVDAVAKSYKQFGQRKPIVVRKEKDGYVVIAGNHSLAAAKKLGWKKIAVTIVDEDEKISRAYALADNRTHDLGSYDVSALFDMLEDVQDNKELLDATSYSQDDMIDLAAMIDENEIKDIEIGGSDLGTENIKNAAERYSSMSSQMFILSLENDKFVWLINTLKNYCKENKIENNAEAVVDILVKVTGKKRPKWN